jgi:pyruvate ferredoxin oxidoreductase alpha subunit
MTEAKKTESRIVKSGAQAIAEAVKLCRPGVIAAYPITPQTLISEALAEMVADGSVDAEMIKVESEQSAIAACVGASATGVRTYTATASQGLALMHEILFIASGLRLPIVMAVANRSLSAPLNIWNDQQDSFSQRDTGWIQLYVENAQEAFDTQIQAFKIAEEMKLPVMVCLDGYVVSHTYEPIEILESEKVRKFLPPYKSKVSLNPSKPVTMGTLATPEYFIKFRKQQQDALQKSIEVIKRVNREYASISGRSYGNGLIETSGMEGKKHAIITIGSVAGTVRALLEEHEIGLIKIKTLRPFPVDEIIRECQNLHSVGVLEKDISLGANGALYDEVKSALYSAESKPKILGFIAGLGGKDITLNDMKGVIEKIKSGKESVEWLV